MRIAQLTVAVCNPADLERRWEGLFAIDSGALDCIVPGNRLREIGIERTRERVYERSDGSTVALPVGCAHFEFMGEFVPAIVIIGADDAEPVLGMLALQSIGIEIDTRNERLRRRHALRLQADWQEAAFSPPINDDAENLGRCFEQIGNHILS